MDQETCDAINFWVYHGAQIRKPSEQEVDTANEIADSDGVDPSYLPIYPECFGGVQYNPQS